MRIKKQKQVWMKVRRWCGRHPLYGKFRITIEIPFHWHPSHCNRKRIGKAIALEL